MFRYPDHKERREIILCALTLSTIKAFHREVQTSILFKIEVKPNISIPWALS